MLNLLDVALVLLGAVAFPGRGVTRAISPAVSLGLAVWGVFLVWTPSGLNTV